MDLITKCADANQRGDVRRLGVRTLTGCHAGVTKSRKKSAAEKAQKAGLL
jgi:hypothetical protein